MSEQNNQRCVVLLPAGPFFTRLFDEILAPALTASGYLPGLMQRISPSPVPAAHLIQQIDHCHLLLVDLSENTPEIWFTAGYATASGKPLCLISSLPEPASPLSLDAPAPIAYPATAFPSDFHELQQHILRWLAAYAAVSRQNVAQQQPETQPPVPAHRLAEVLSSTPLSVPQDDFTDQLSTDNDLASYEVLALKLIDLKTTEDGLSPRDLALQMRDNQSAHLTSHAMNALKRRGFIERREVNVTEGVEIFLSDRLFLTPLGEQWLVLNEKRSTRSGRSDAGSLTFQSL